MSLRQLDADFEVQSRRLLLGGIGAVLILFAVSTTVMLLWR